MPPEDDTNGLTHEQVAEKDPRAAYAMAVKELNAARERADDADRDAIVERGRAERAETELNAVAKYGSAATAAIEMGQEFERRMARADDCIDALRTQLKVAEQGLVLIGERAVVDWDDKTVGDVDAVVKNPERYVDWLKEVMGKAKRTEAAEERAVDAAWAGYETGHHDTVESQYTDPGEVADDIVRDLADGSLVGGCASLRAKLTASEERAEKAEQESVGYQSRLARVGRDRDALRAENEALRRERDTCFNDATRARGGTNDALDERDAAQAEVARLRDTLRWCRQYVGWMRCGDKPPPTHTLWLWTKIVAALRVNLLSEAAPEASEG